MTVSLSGIKVGDKVKVVLRKGSIIGGVVKAATADSLKLSTGRTIKSGDNDIVEIIRDNRGKEIRQ